MSARGPLGLLARLELRHARSDLRFLLFAAGADIDEDRGFLERAYQLYLLAIAAVVVALSWAQVVSLVEGARDALGSVAGVLSMLLLALVPASALAAWSLLVFRQVVLSRMGTPDVFPDYSGYAASASPSRACRIVFHPSAFLSFPLRYHSM